ncbi:MAG: glucose-6-phosphate dehydrogenase [bacterium]|nr:glucose-6-phosphate dehydrogenase [bacterium]
MKLSNRPHTIVFTIFGAGGDLTRRKLIPALYNLYLDEWLPDRFAILGIDMREMSDDDFRSRLRGGVDEFSRRGRTEDDKWAEFAARLVYLRAGFDQTEAYVDLGRRLAALDQQWGQPAAHIYYLAIPPMAIETVCDQLRQAGLTVPPDRARIVVEKPFGTDLDSARRLIARMNGLFDESQIYRIDHFLGKETVQNILALRFANSLFEPLWNRRYIDHVQITVAERIGVGHRGGYYEGAGALRDMVQNHLHQVLCLVAMEAPVSFNADEIRNKKVDVLRAIRPIPPDQVSRFAVRGQYGPGWLRCERAAGYREEPGVAPDSDTETFAAVKYYIDNWRWHDVPFYLRTGKRLPAQVSEVIIRFHPVPHQSFPPSAAGAWSPNRLVIRIQPDEGIELRFQAKHPGPVMNLSAAEMRFSYKETFHATPPEAYETLLLDVMIADATQFMRADQVEIAWRVIMPILEAWSTVAPGNFPNYAAGTWGPEEAATLIARDGRNWVLPTVPDDPAGEGEGGE